MKIRQGRTMRIYWFFTAILLSVFANFSSGNTNLYFPGQFKSLPRIGRRSGSDIGPGRYPWNDIYRPAASVDRNPLPKFGGPGETKENTWDRLLSSNDFLLPGNEMLFYRKPIAMTRFQDVADDRTPQFDNSNGIFNYGDK